MLQLLEALARRAARVARAEMAVDNGKELGRAGAAEDRCDGAVGGLLAQQLQPLHAWLGAWKVPVWWRQPSRRSGEYFSPQSAQRRRRCRHADGSDASARQSAQTARHAISEASGRQAKTRRSASSLRSSIKDGQHASALTS